MSKNCDKVYKSANELNKHVLKHSGMVWDCGEKDCYYSTEDHRNLHAHKRKHWKRWKLEVSSAYHAINILNTLCSSKDIKLNQSVRPRGLIKVWNVVLNVITCQFSLCIELYLDKYCCNVRG